MKKLVLLSAIVLGGMAYNNKANAQISIHLGFNVPVRHVYVPAPPPVETVYDDDYDNSDDYYYLPDVEAYYSIPNHCYYYNDGNTWISAAYLPGAYRNYDWRNARRFEIRGRRPYMHHDVYRSKWGGNDNRGNWGRRDDNFAGRGFGNGGGFNRDNRGGGNYGPRDYRNGYGQPNFGGRNGGNYNNGQQPQNNGNRGRGGWDGQSAGGNGYGQPNQYGGGQQPQQPGQSGGHGNWGGGQQQQPSQGNGGGSQSNQNGGGGYNRGNGGGNAQPSNQNGGGHDRGNNNGGGQVAQNNMRSNIRMNEAMRPARF